MNEIEISKQKQILKANRLSAVKNFENKYSEIVVNNYKENAESKKNHQHFVDVLRTYKQMVDEIDFLSKKKDEFLKNFGKSKIDAEKQEEILRAYMEEVNFKKEKFDIFIREKGKEALLYFKQEHERKNYEDNKYKEIKKQAFDKEKFIEFEKIQIFRENQEKLKKQNDLNFDQPDIFSKIKQNFHNHGNNIDYSTTRFHNIEILKHAEDFSEFLNAYEKAQKEEIRTKETQKQKENTKKKFDEVMTVNNFEELRKIKAKENLKKLTDELSKVNKMRSNAKQKEKPSLNEAEFNNKKSEQLIKTRLLEVKIT